jgi:hypothetical protein
MTDWIVSQTLRLVQQLIAEGEIRISDHGYDELAADNISIREILDGVGHATVVEDYPEYFKGPCVLVLQTDARSAPIHVVWGIVRNSSTPAVLVTAYRPLPERWSSDFKTRS